MFFLFMFKCVILYQLPIEYIFCVSFIVIKQYTKTPPKWYRSDYIIPFILDQSEPNVENKFLNRT